MLTRILFVVAALSASGLALAQDRAERVSFARGASDTTVRGSVTGYQTISYYIAAGAGQRLTVDLQTDNPSNYFNVTAPGAQQAMFIGSISGSRFDTRLPSSGDYVISVYLMRSAAQRNERANYFMTIGAYGQSTPIAGPQPGQGGGYWQVAGLAAGDILNLREAPSTGALILAQYNAGTILQDYGCATVASQQWCQVQVPNGQGPIGWVAGRYLRPAIAPPPVAYPPPVPPAVVYPPQPRPPIAGPPITSKCRQDSQICIREAARNCNGSFRVIDSDSHAGGLVTDAVPGPIVWYSMTYSCGPSDGRYPKFAFRGPPLGPPVIGLPGGPEQVRQKDMQRYCRREAADKYRQQARDVLTLPVEVRRNGERIVRGQFPPKGRKVTNFTCTFSKNGVFRGVHRD